MKTKVVYRKFPEGDIIALFPQIPSGPLDGCCLSYQQIGQHAPGYPALCNSTSPASPAEYAPLHRELTALGYDLVIGQRCTAFDAAMRRAEAQKARVAA